jgi:hypothetical protein
MRSRGSARRGEVVSLDRFCSPWGRDREGICLDTSSRDYLEQQAGADAAYIAATAPRVDYRAIWRDLGAAGGPPPAHVDECLCIRCEGWREGRRGR